VCNIVVERDDLVRDFQHAKDKYVEITEEELDPLEAEANSNIDLKEFIPLESVDPVYFENTHYPGHRQRRGEALSARADPIVKSTVSIDRERHNT
jgi:DNA end-binding protein Ku